MNSHRNRLGLLLGAFLFFGLSGIIGAQTMRAAGTSAVARPDWGAKDRILSHIAFTQFIPQNPQDNYRVLSGTRFGLYNPDGKGSYVAVAHIPSGALLIDAELDYCDTSDTDNVFLSIADCDLLGSDCQLLLQLASAQGPTGCASVSQPTPGYTVDNGARQLLLTAFTFGGETTSLAGASIGYKLQLSVAPVSPTFGDVPASHPYYRAIEALASSGITGGCGNGNFCPSQNVTRGEMAAFLARALGLHFQN